MEDRQLNYNQPLPFYEAVPIDPNFSGGAKDQGMRGDPLAKLPPSSSCIQIRAKVSPKLSSGRTMNVKKQSLDKVRDSNRNFASQRVNVVPNEASKGGEAAACEGSKKGVSEEGDEVYVDAQDTLSRTESFFFNCSLSGISGLDGPDNGVSGKFSTNPEMQDFMMDRFLPAAQAMASETPPRLDSRGGDDHDDDDDGEYDEPEKSSFKGCGLLPRFCLKTFCLLNQVPSVKTQAAGHVSLAHRVQAKSARNVSGKERSSEHACDLVSQKRYVNRHPVPGIQDDKLMPNSKSSPINKITCMRESPRADRPFKSRNFQGVSSVHFKTESSHPILQEERKFCGNTRSTENSRVDDFVPPGKALPSFRQFLISEDNAGDTGFTAPSVEKTLYVDRVHVIRSRNSDTSSSDKTGIPDFRRDELAADEMNYKFQEAHSVDFSAEEDKYSSALDETEMEHERSESTDSISLFPHHRFNEDTQIDVIRPRQSIDVKITYEVCSDGKSGLGSQFSLSAVSLIEDLFLLLSCSDLSLKLLPAKPSTELAVHLGL
ncbi:hypothetical protein NL676_017354 [Syzygium grande]|nr:hypothetical protein NL676_017354 [Syzygium grande]